MDKKQAPKQKPQKKHEKHMELSEKMLRLQAEFDNYKKRMAKEKQEITGQAEAKFILRLLPIYEELLMAKKEAEKIPDLSMKKGILLVLEKLAGSFEKEGLQKMELKGQKFDPFRHEAAMKEDSVEPEGTITKVIQAGYLFRGNVLRHAIVAVSSGKKEK